MQPAHTTVTQQLAMNPDGTLPFQKSDRMRNTVHGRNAQAQVNMIGKAMPFQQLDPTLTTQVSQNGADPVSQLAIENLLAILGNKHHMVLAFPPNMGQTSPIVHWILLPAPTGLSGGRIYAHNVYNGTVEPLPVHGQRPWV